MSLRGYYTTYLRNLMQSKELGAVDYTPPATLYFAWHIATTLSTGVSSGTSTISTVAPIAAGANLIIAPSYTGATDLNAEQHVVLSSSGGGPYTITLTTNVSSNHLSGAYVAFDPGDDCAEILEPVGNAYARASKVNNATNFPGASGGESDSGNAITWATPTGVWGLGTHAISFNTSTTGNARIVAVLQSFLLLNTSTAPPLLGTGNFRGLAEKPS